MTEQDEEVVADLMRKAAAAIEAVRDTLGGSRDNLLMSGVLAVAAGMAVADATWPSESNAVMVMQSMASFLVGGARNHQITLMARAGCAGTA
jgi:hypothetical protein